MPVSERGKQLRALSHKIAHRVREDGLNGLLRRGLSEANAWRRKFGHAAPQDPFDSEYGIDTGGVVPLWKLDIDSPYGDEGVRYQTLDPGLLRELIGCLPIRHEDFVYVDLGSGKGRSLLVASEYPFRRVIGVEFSRELNEIATRNILRYPRARRRSGDISSIRADAADFEFPPDKLVVFLYNPFGAVVLSRVLENLGRSLREHPREVWIIYCNPVLSDLLDESGFLQRIDLPIEAAIYKTAY